MFRMRGFTLIEIVLVVVIMMLLMLLAVPSLSGLAADRRLRRSLDDFSNVVREARELSVTERRPYLVVWDGKQFVVRPEFLAKDEKPDALPPVKLSRMNAFKITFPDALTKNPPAEWIFWPTGTCEPAIVQFSGRDGKWTAKYSGLSMEPRLMTYVAR